LRSDDWEESSGEQYACVTDDYATIVSSYNQPHVSIPRHMYTNFA